MANEPVLTDEQLRYFWSRVAHGAESECWPWAAYLDNRAGYGKLSIGGRTLRPHRVAWSIANGPIPPGLGVLHRCDNPPCVNPSHLFVGTHADNMRDMVKKGRVRRGEAVAGAKLTEADVVEIRLMAQAGVATVDIATKYGVDSGHVTRVIKGILWPHVGGALQPRQRRGRLDEDTVAALRAGWAEGTTVMSLSEAYGVGETSVRRVVRDETYPAK